MGKDVYFPFINEFKEIEKSSVYKNDKKTLMDFCCIFSNTIEP